MTTTEREITMQDRLLVAAHVTMLAQNDPPLQVIADTIIDCVRCCDYFPECAHVVAESERVDREEGRPTTNTELLMRMTELASSYGSDGRSALAEEESAEV